MILGDELTPLSQLSSAFLAAEDAAPPAIRLLRVGPGRRFPGRRRFGLPALKGVLDDLGAGMPINEALPRRTKMTLDQLDRDVRAVRARAGRERRPRRDLGGARPAGRRRFGGGRGLAREASQELPGPAAPGGAARGRGEVAARPRRSLEKLKALYPEYVGPENAYVLLAAVYKQTVRPGRGARGPRGAGGARRRREPGLPAADGAGRGGRRLAGRGEERAPAAGGQPADPGPAPPARPRRRAAGRARRGDRPPTAPWRCSTTPTRPRCITAWRSSCSQAGKPRRGPPRGPQVARGSPAVPRRAPAPARAGRTRHSPSRLPPTPTPSREAPTHDATTPDPGSRSRCLLAIVAGAGRWRSPVGRVGGGRARRRLPDDRAGVPNWKVDERFKNDVFTFVRVEYDSGYGGGAAGRLRRRLGRRGRWATDWPDSDLNFSFRLQQLTSLKVNPDPITLRLTDERALRLPVPLHDRAGRPRTSRRRRSWRCAATCSTAAS